MTPIERAELFAVRFRGQANHIAFQFGGRVYLVGSMLTSDAPGDIDIRCMIEREDADLWFGRDADGAGPEWTPSSLARCREELKQSRRLTRRWKLGNGEFRTRIDFQFQIMLIGQHDEPVDDDRPRIRLDVVPNDMLRAGRGDP